MPRAPLDKSSKKRKRPVWDIDVNMQIKLETQRCVMAPSLIRSACRKSPREGGAALLIVRRHCTALLSPNDGHSSCHSTQYYYYKFFFCWICKFSQSGYLLHVFSLFVFPKRKLRKRFISRERGNTRGDCVATNGTHIPGFSFICLLLSPWKVFPLGLSKNGLSNVFCNSKCICFSGLFSVLLREISRYLFSCPQDLSLYMNLSTFIVKTL